MQEISFGVAQNSQFAEAFAAAVNTPIKRRHSWRALTKNEILGIGLDILMCVVAYYWAETKGAGSIITQTQQHAASIEVIDGDYCSQWRKSLSTCWFQHSGRWPQRTL